MKTETLPTIAELWNEADGLIRLSIPHIEKLARPDYRVNEERRPIYAQQLASCNERLQSLRQQLVERCEKVWDADGVYTRFTIYTERGVTNPRTFVQSMGGIRFDTPETAANYIGAYAFWAWELEQREKEAANGN